mgnify:CR=1 FL=1
MRKPAKSPPAREDGGEPAGSSLFVGSVAKAFRVLAAFETVAVILFGFLAVRLKLPALVGYTGGAWGEVMLKVVDVYPGDVAANGVAIAEIKVSAGSIEEF